MKTIWVKGMMLGLAVVLVVGGYHLIHKDKEETVFVGAASSLKTVLDDDLIQEFEEQYPNIHVETTYASSGTLETQIENGLAVQVFLSASKDQVQSLQTEGYIEHNNVQLWMKNQMVLIVPRSNPKKVKTFTDLSKCKYVSLGDPNYVPAGKYAKKVLQKVEIWDGIKDNIIYANNVTQVVQQVSSGDADAGIVYKTDAIASSNQVAVVDDASDIQVERPKYYLAAIGEKDDATEKLLSFLQGKESKETLKTYGFSVE